MQLRFLGAKNRNFTEANTYKSKYEVKVLGVSQKSSSSMQNFRVS